MKFLLLDSFSLNSGDEGILVSTVEAMRKEFGASEISIEVSHPDISRRLPELSTCTLVPRIIDIRSFMSEVRVYPMILSVILGLVDWAGFFLWSASVRLGAECIFFIRPSRRYQASLMKSADTVISVGGGFLSTNYHYWLRLATYAIVYTLGKPLYIMAQSVGPFSSPISKICIPAALRRASLVTVREPVTRDYLQGFGLKHHRETADMAFLLNPQKSPNKPHGRQGHVAICLKSDGDVHKERQFERAVYETARYLLGKGFRVIILCHTRTDEPMATRLGARLPAEVDIRYFGIHPKILKRLYLDSSFVIAARMHAIVFSSAGRVPFVAVSYEQKFSGLLSQLGYDKSYMIPYGKISGTLLIEKSRIVLRNRAQLSDSLSGRLPAIRNAARQNMRLLSSLS